MPRAGGLGAGGRTPSPSSQGGRTRGSLARAGAAPFAARRVVAPLGIHRGRRKTALPIRHGGLEMPPAWRIAGCASSRRGHQSRIAARRVARC